MPNSFITSVDPILLSFNESISSIYLCSIFNKKKTRLWYIHILYFVFLISIKNIFGNFLCVCEVFFSAVKRLSLRLLPIEHIFRLRYRFTFNLNFIVINYTAGYRYTHTHTGSYLKYSQFSCHEVYKILKFIKTTINIYLMLDLYSIQYQSIKRMLGIYILHN